MKDGLTIAGLLLNFIGAWCLAYDLLWGYPRENLRARAEMRLEAMQRFFAQMDFRIDGLSEPLYTSSEKEREKERIREKYSEEMNALKSEIASYGEKHSEMAHAIGLIGAVLLSIGFVLQLIDVL